MEILCFSMSLHGKIKKTNDNLGECIMSLKCKLKQIRYSLGMTRREFYKIFPELKYSTYCNYERSESYPKLEYAFIMVAAINRKLSNNELPPVKMEDIWSIH